jgi:hypothetical protein
MNGTIPEIEPLNGRRRWRRVVGFATTTIQWNGAEWEVSHEDQPADVYGTFTAEQDVETPDLADEYFSGDAFGVISLAFGPQDPTEFLTMACATEGADIYYTTDGSFPGPGNDEATLYAGPIPDTEIGTEYRAAAYAPPLNPSDVLEFRIVVPQGAVTDGGFLVTDADGSILVDN